MAQKNLMLFLASIGETGLSHAIFFSHSGQMTINVEILGLRLRNFATVPESLAPHLQKVR